MVGLMREGEKMERLRRRWFQDYGIQLFEGSKTKKGGTNEKIVDNTCHAGVISTSAYQAFKPLEYRA
jgi:hypothetical protein